MVETDHPQLSVGAMRVGLDPAIKPLMSARAIKTDTYADHTPAGKVMRSMIPRGGGSS